MNDTARDVGEHEGSIPSFCYVPLRDAAKSFSEMHLDGNKRSTKNGATGR